MKRMLVYAIAVPFLLSRSTNNAQLTEFIHISPQIDVCPTDDQFVSVNESTQWNHRHHTQRKILIYDNKNYEGLVSFSDLPTSTTDDESFGFDMRLLEEEHSNASDADGDGLLNLAELNEESDMDRDGKVSFKEFFLRLFYHLAREYDKGNYIDPHYSDDSMHASAKVLFSQLDKDCDGHLSDTELLPVIGKLHPSEHYYATKQSENFIPQAQDDKDGNLILTKMIEYARILYDAIYFPR